MIVLSKRRCGLSLAALFWAIALSFRAGADERALTSYERARVSDAKTMLGVRADPDPNPEGKLVERVDVVVLEVFDGSDPMPGFVNVFHARTRERVVRRELLFAEGEAFVRGRVDESARNLRDLPQHSLVVILPFPGTTPERVRVLVLVKDVWSLRLNFDIAASDRELSYLLIAPTEENLLGTHTTFGGRFTLDAGTYSIGALALKRRLFASDLAATVAASAIYGRTSNRPEGAEALFTYGMPFTRSDQAWSFGTGVYLRDETKRRYQGLRLTRYDAPSTPEADALPIAYRSERLIGGVEVVRSFGRRQKVDVALGMDADRRYYRWEPPAGTSATAQADFREQWVPVTDTRVSPFLQLFAREERFLHASDIETLGLEEAFRLGPAALLRVYPASSRLGSTRDLAGIVAGAAYTLAIGDGFVRVAAQNRIELERHGRHDADAIGRVRLVLPKAQVVRLVLDAFARERYENYLNRSFELGGDTRLRGYPPAGFRGSFVGAAAAAVNLELRSVPVDILGVQSGLAAFYDAGHAAERLSTLSFKQSAGAGVRMVFPQFSRLVMRLDWAFPFNPVAGGPATFPGGLFLSFDQAFSLPELGAPTVMKPQL